MSKRETGFGGGESLEVFRKAGARCETEVHSQQEAGAKPESKAEWGVPVSLRQWQGVGRSQRGPDGWGRQGSRGRLRSAGPGCSRLCPGGGSGHRSAAFFAFLFLHPNPQPPAPLGLRSIDTCAGPAPAANIFLMSSRGLKPARSALQGGFSPGRCFGRRRRSEALEMVGTTNLSL